MEFVALTIGMVAVLVAVLVLIGRAYPGGASELLDWKPTRSYETEAQLEADDVAQMIEAQNALRRKKGKPELDEADVQRMADEDEAVRERGRWPER